jgi:CubicO group peptidase (beta-lactamase class C family)
VRIEGAPHGEILRRRMFDPLGMEDVGFDVPTFKQVRVAEFYGLGRNGQLMAWDRHRPEESAFLPRRHLEAKAWSLARGPLADGG